MRAPIFLPHEHVFSKFRSSDTGAVEGLLRASLAQAAAVGVKDIVDLTPYTSPLAYARFVKDSPVNLHGCVGFYTDNRVARDVRARTIPELAAGLVRKYHRNSSVMHIAAIKVAARHASLTSFELKAFSAAAIVHRELGLPIVTHSADGAYAHLRVLIDAGVDPSRILLSHPELGLKGRAKRSVDDVYLELLKVTGLGASVCITDVHPSQSRADSGPLELVKRLVDAGRIDRIMISGDSSWKVDRQGAHFQGAGVRRVLGFTLTLDTQAKLAALGLSTPEIDHIFSHNPYAFYRIHRPFFGADKE